ncbi:hypothetical protein M4951_24625 [Blastopirellula sp. J2-11]|uniref:hypothetical protein n=1 Tax=Blastopirellula sp. J2-11 TaxID=2943192 RepID=UPI0021C5E6C0|nr:hypothetical protein [Blastopirellula sp. J2-11]UUO06515.1 hypothetical protein M4951_24625 [Blastopirellula sp. J2-11]
MKTIIRASLAWACLLTAAVGSSFAQTQESDLSATLQQSQQAGKFTFVLFYRDNAAQTQQMLNVVNQTLAARSEQVTIATANVMSPAGQAMAEKFRVSRAPMPMTVAVAPNGAVTGLFSRQVSKAGLDAAIVPPVMMECMKQLQDQKLVFVCLTRSEQASVPTGVRTMQLDPLFKDRIALIGLNVEDAAETKLMQQLKVSADQVQGPYAALIAPPGVLVGHFNSASTADQIAAAIHKAGKCCEDPNCKHAASAEASQSTPVRR